MPIYRLNCSLLLTNVSLRTPTSFIAVTMLSKAVKQYPGQPTTKPQKPLHPIMAAVNIAKPPESNKRKLDRAMSNTSSLGALHESTYFYNENDFDDDAAIDLTGPSPP